MKVLDTSFLIDYGNEVDAAGESAVLDDTPHLSTTTTGDGEQDDECAEPDVSVYSDMLLLVNALEREDLTTIDSTPSPTANALAAESVR
jgi:hypothetical protein